MKINNIVKLNLETRAKDLRAGGMSHADIAKVLSLENKFTITKDSVQRYFLADTGAKAEVIERSDKLKKKIVEAEISTIKQRMDVILSLIEIGSEARLEGDRRGAVLALRAATDALHKLDERLGVLNPANTLIQINNNSSKLEYMSDAELIEIIKRGQPQLIEGVEDLE
jgi:DNA-binding transcriptional MerR regulator